jgi:alpha-beta hydrolase superfamily lysophospholipase
MSSTTFTWQNAKGLKLFAQDWRPPGTLRGVVSLVHGLGEHSGRYQHVADTLNEAGFGLVGFDLPGHGRSAGTRGHAAYAEVIEDIDCLLKETARRYPSLPHFLYGHSLGGALVLYFCLKRHPDLKGVIASSPGLAVGDPVPPAKLLLAKVMARLAPSFTIENGLDVNNLSHDPAVIHAYQNDPLVHTKISTRLGLDLLTSGAWILEQAPRFPLPLLLIQGSGDHLVSPQTNTAFAKAVPQDKITYKIWEGQYHETHNEPEKQQALQYIIGWLDSHL